MRLDGLATEHVAEALATVERPVVASCRRHRDGGAQALDEGARHGRLLAALHAGAAFVDVEDDADFREALTREALRHGTDVIVSHHDLDATPGVKACLDLLDGARAGADVVKLATRVEGPGDVQTLFEVALAAPTMGVPFAVMGVGDSALRAAAGPLGMALVYTAPGSVSVPGQLAVALQRALPRAPPPPEGFRDFVLLGASVGHSLSPRMQNAAFAWLDEPARYRPIDIPATRLEAAIEGLKAMGVAGGNVTSPHKGRVYALCDETHPVAREARAVNTFRFDGETIVGHTTDGLGVVAALQARGQALSGRRVVVVGAGGTARSAAHALVKAGADVRVSNRTAERARTLANEVGCEAIPFDADALAGALPAEAVLLNATPVDLPLADETLARITVFDATYGPGRAALARRAALAGSPPLDGLDLLVHQGDLALRFWLDVAADDELLGVMSCAARTGALEQRFGRRDV